MADRISYLRNEALPTIRPGYPGNKLFGKEFANGDVLYEPSFSTVLKWQMTTNPQKEEKKRDTWVPEVVDCTEFLRGTDDGLVWLGHSSFLLRIEATTLLFDPLLFSSFGLKRRHALPCRPEDLTNIDFLLLSHGHRDHMDEQSIRLLAKQNPAMQVLTGLRNGSVFKPWLTPYQRGHSQEAGWWQQYLINWENMGWTEPDNPPFEIYYLPALHWARRGLFDLNETLWGSFLLRVGEKLLYFAGDTCYGDHFEAIEKQFGPLDLVFMPIGAYKPPFMMGQSHVNPQEAAKAVNVLRAGHAVPMHHGTFDLSDEPASEPIRLFTEIAAQGMLRAELHAPAVGEVMRWQEWE